MSSILSDKKIHLYPGVSNNSASAGFWNDSNSAGNLYATEAQLSCDVWEDKNNIYIKSIVAGVKPDDLEIVITNDLLTIRGSRNQDDIIDEDSFYCRECYFGTFSRSIVLPREVNEKKIEANIKNGILLIKLPKKYKTSAIKIQSID